MSNKINVFLGYRPSANWLDGSTEQEIYFKDSQHYKKRVVDKILEKTTEFLGAEIENNNEIVFDNKRYVINFNFELEDKLDKFKEMVNDNKVKGFCYYHYGYNRCISSDMETTVENGGLKSLFIKNNFDCLYQLSDINEKKIDNNIISGELTKPRTIYVDDVKIVDINDRSKYLINNVYKYLAYYIFTKSQLSSYKEIYGDSDEDKLKRIKCIYELYRTSRFDGETEFNKVVFGAIQKHHNIDKISAEVSEYSRICFDNYNARQTRKLSMIMILVAVVTFFAGLIGILINIL